MCALLHLAVYCELTFGPTTTGQDSFVFGTGKNLDNHAYHIISKALALGEFEGSVNGCLGTHSIRKGASTYAAKSGAGKDDITNRGRWRTTTIVNRYISVDLPVPDAKMAVLLAGPKGACAYKVKESAKEFVTDEFIVRDVAPTISAVLGQKMALVLGRALLWASVDFAERVPEVLRLPILERLVAAGRSADINPVMRVPIVATGPGGRLTIVEIGQQVGEGESNGSNMVSAADRTTISYESTNSAALLSSVIGLQRRLEDVGGSLGASVVANHGSIMRRLEAVEAAMRRIALQPVARMVVGQGVGRAVGGDGSGGGGGGGGGVGGGARREMIRVKLSARPKDLYVLWAEWEHGVAGTKPARTFTRAERGANRFAFCRRRVFWDMVVSLVARGHTSDRAVDKIYAVYGRGLGVTAILRKMTADRKLRGGHPELAA